MLADDRRLLTPGKARELLALSGGPQDDAEVAFAFAALHRRANRSSAWYPFRFSTIGFERIPDKPYLPYATLLILAAESAGTVSLNDGGAGAVVLERLACEASSYLFGAGGMSLRFGFPPEPDRPNGFHEALAWLAGRLGVELLRTPKHTRDFNDGGVDVVAWRPFADQLTGVLVAWIQVTHQQDLRAKSLEIAANDLWKLFRLGIPPIAVVATSEEFETVSDLYDEISNRVLVLDRWRLLELLADRAEPVAIEVEAWAGDVLGGINL